MFGRTDQNKADIKFVGKKRIPKLKQQTIVPAELVRHMSRHANKNKKSDKDFDKIHKLIAQMRFDDSVPLYISTISGALAFVNDSYCTLVSSCDEADQNKGEGSRLPSGLLAILNEVQLTRQNVTVEENINLKGSVRQFRSRHFPVCDEDGKVIAVGGTYVDCTDKLQILDHESLMQQRYRDFARATSDWYWEIDRDYNITFSSDRLMAITGKHSAFITGKRFEQFGQLKSDENENFSNSEIFLDAMKPFRDQLLILQDFEGKAVYNWLSGVPLFDPSTGEFQGYRGAAMDVTNMHMARAEARAAQKSLENTLEELTNKNIQLDMASAESEAALGAKSEFLAAMSHELRTPLNAIIGFAEAMKMEVFGELNSRYVSYSEDIMSAGQHLLELINDVLDVAVLDSGKIALDMEDVSLQNVIAKAQNLIILRAHEKNLDVSEISLDEDCPIFADERRAVQIFVNLLSNAVKFTPDHGRIGIRIARGNSSQVAVTVWDTGVGIPLDQQELVFEKFQQVTDNIYSRKEEGTGLGLHISSHLAKLMGGDITLKSVINEGSEFTVTFNVSEF